MPEQKKTSKEVLQSAWRTFHRGGYHGTSVQQLADEAGLSKAGLLHHFSSKRGVMEAVIDYALSWWERHVLRTLTGEKPFEDRLRSVLEHHIQLVRVDRRGCFFANVILETSQQQLFTERLSRFHRMWIDHLAVFLSERFPTGRAEVMADRLFAEYEGTVLIYKLYGDDAVLDRFVDRVVNELK